MAGHRRRHQKEFQWRQSIARRRKAFNKALAAADSPTKRVRAATDYLTSALAKTPSHQATAVAEEIVQILTKRADALFKARGGRTTDGHHGEQPARPSRAS